MCDGAGCLVLLVVHFVLQGKQVDEGPGADTAWT